MSEPATPRKHTDDEIQTAHRQIVTNPDSEIDTSDITEINEVQWATAQKGKNFRPYKTSITIRLDADLLEWFKTHSENGGYQTKINSILRRHMIEAIKSAG